MRNKRKEKNKWSIVKGIMALVCSLALMLGIIPLPGQLGDVKMEAQAADDNTIEVTGIGVSNGEIEVTVSYDMADGVTENRNIFVYMGKSGVEQQISQKPITQASGTMTVSSVLMTGYTDLYVDYDKKIMLVFARVYDTSSQTHPAKSGEKYVKIVLDDSGNLTDAYFTDLDDDSDDTDSDSDSSQSKNQKSKNAKSKKDKTIAAVVPACNHNFRWEKTQEATETEDALLCRVCSNCGAVSDYMKAPNTAYNAFIEETVKRIEEAPAQGEASVETKLWISFDRRVMDALQTRQDVSLTVEYLYQGEEYRFTIPAGSDTQALLDENGYSGFLYLTGQMQGGLK